MASLEEIFNHVALPPRLPGQQAAQLSLIEGSLTQRMIDATRVVRDLTSDPETYRVWDSVRLSLETCRTLNQAGRLSKASLLTAFRQLSGHEVLILHIAEQNSGLLIRLHGATDVLVEAFEASPSSAKVLESKAALQWDFPGYAVKIPVSEFDNPSFQNEVAAFLEQASTESVKRFGAQTVKGGSNVFETRDTGDPSLITQLLLTIFEVNGTQAYPPILRKRVRDDVNFINGNERPWRRLPFWLVLRVALQRHLCTVLGGESGRAHYKYLVCLMLSQLMKDCLGHLDFELVAFLKTKLCRRLVKLDSDKTIASAGVQSVYCNLSTLLKPIFEQSVTHVSEVLSETWATFKKNLHRKELALPRQAHPRHLYLSLPNSGLYLRQILAQPLYRQHVSQQLTEFRLPKEYDAKSGSLKKSIAFASSFFSLAEFEAQLEIDSATIWISATEEQCVAFAIKIARYMDQVGTHYDGNPEQKSVMLLTIMELWMVMDQRAVALYPLLAKFEPGFPTNILEVLFIPELHDMQRVAKIRDYLSKRHVASERLTIFSDPTNGCFAERYYNESRDSSQLQELHQQIEDAAALAKVRKENEWQILTAEYEELLKVISKSTCLYETAINEFGQTRRHNDQECQKCRSEAKVRRFRKINIHEHPLPTDIMEAKTVIFELCVPRAFSRYRDITWRIIGSLALPKLFEGGQPTIKLEEYSELRAYWNSQPAPNFSLASEKKSFLIAHWRSLSFPVEKKRVCLPNGMKLFYYDRTLNVWPGWMKSTPTFKHHCDLVLLENSPYSSFRESIIENPNGPSSYEVISSQTKCPPGLNVHEFMAYQSLLAGSARRWPQILIELGSSNLNFSAESTTFLMSLLALKIGPPGPARQQSPLGVIHAIFQDDVFPRKLIAQLHQRLDGISSNWRETNSIETIITLALRLVSLAPTVAADAVQLLEMIRTITLGWIGLLRSEIGAAKDISTSRKCSEYALWAALLCRRTFTMCADRGMALLSGSLRCFIESAMALQDNLAGDPGSLPLLLKSALIRDFKMVFSMRFMLRQCLKDSPSSLTSAITSIWPDTEGEPARTFSQMGFLDGPSEWWFQLTIDATLQTKEQTLHFNLLEGHLLVNHQPLGKLPTEYRNLNVMRELFGNQNLLTYPSYLPGMKFMLSILMFGHQIHLGFRNELLVIRAVRGRTRLELVNRANFRSSDGTLYDLPVPLVDECFHWLDIATKVLEIRPASSIWTSKCENWRLDLNRNQARRGILTLVDPQSPLFGRVARIFDGFEHPYHLTLVQPDRRALTVELRRLALSFAVNSRNLLESAQLRSEIDPNQDAGTWYGLKSKLVLRGVVAQPHPFQSLIQRQRSIIVPAGDLQFKRNGPHVEITVNPGQYAIFTINEALGRLDCPAETRLLCLKAQFHACTSFVLPDPLTGRTGSEEAIHCLTSGYSQPWKPLTLLPYKALMLLASLTPVREYYPNDRKVMQSCFWNAKLTATIQHDGLSAVVDTLLKKSDQLSIFDLDYAELPPLPPSGNSGLTIRSLLRREVYQRLDAHSSNPQAIPEDLVYSPRDGLVLSQGRNNVILCAKLLRSWPSNIPTPSNLAGILQSWSNFGGYAVSFDKIIFNDRLDVDLAAEWGSLVLLCQNSNAEDVYRLMFLFGLMSFRNDANIDILCTLIAFSVLDDLKSLKPPQWPSFEWFRSNQVPSTDHLLKLIENCRLPYSTDLVSKQRRKLEAAKHKYKQRQDDEASSLVAFLMSQWPCVQPSMAAYSLPEAGLIDIVQAMDIIRPEWQRLYQNFKLAQHINQVQKVLDKHRAECSIELPTSVSKEQDVYSIRSRGAELPNLRDLLKVGLQQCQRRTSLRQPTTSRGTHKSIPTVSREIQELRRINEGFMSSESAVRQQYGKDLAKSLRSLQQQVPIATTSSESVTHLQLPAKIAYAQNDTRNRFDSIRRTLNLNVSTLKLLQLGGLLPCITPITLLETLRSTSTVVFGQGMKEALIAWAISITTLQRLLRLEDAFQKGNKQKFADEQANKGHTNWVPVEIPNWLLLEIDTNILIRPAQVDVAKAIITPSSGMNEVSQLMMGQGKTSIIIPMSAAILADGKCLLRVIVPKPLLLQTAQLLLARIGGLVGRQLSHVPFSRKTPTTAETIDQFDAVHRHIQRASGVIIALPEHLLSFKLSGLQQLSDEHLPEAKKMIEIQNWLDRSSRDVLDESDYTLALRTQLIYPSGSQKTVDGHPFRWELAEVILSMVEGHLFYLEKALPHSIAVARRPNGGYPSISFLRKDAEDALLARLVDDIYRGRTSILPKHCSQSDMTAIKQYISEQKVLPNLAQRVRKLFPEKAAARQAVFLLRGLFVHRILLMTLKKRWNVQYGLHPKRDPIAVPYLAKGTPSEQAEWGHPDVAILFTCLSFYSGGLTNSQLRQSLGHVMKSDDPSQVYDRFSQNSNLPDSLREWNSINVDDEAQLQEVWRHVHFNPVAIDYFLNNFVFPKHAKQFEIKLQASGWDLPLFLPENQTSESLKAPQCTRPLTTGFSGTNDGKGMLPLNITQHDLPGLAHTNAEVLSYLLQPRNRGYVVAVDNWGIRLSEIGLLLAIKDMKIRVLIDAGAQILEMDNLALAKAWLDIDTEAPAAVYFNEGNIPCLLYREGRNLPLLASPFAEDLGQCLVYLDEAHTRGTDLKIPALARGALTLGLGQTKDHTVQAAMRLRELATSQSVVFIAPPEVNLSIRDLCKKTPEDYVDSYHVIRWLLEQTCSGIEQLQPLYYSQGADYCRRTEAELANSDFLHDKDQREALLETLRQPEQQSLFQLYGVKSKAKLSKPVGSTSQEINAFMFELNNRRQGFQDTSNAVHGSALQEVEQEREVAWEVQNIREVQKPVHYRPFRYTRLHRDIESFCKTGRLAADSAGYELAFLALNRTTALGRKFGINTEATSCRLYASTEFTRTVELPSASSRSHDDFQRQVNWILWSTVTESALIVNPEEAEDLLNLLTNSKTLFTHLLTYAAPITRKMLHFNDLKFFSVPSLAADWTAPMWLRIELGIFAGRIYFDFEEYKHLASYLGIREASSMLVAASDTAMVLFTTDGGVDDPSEDAGEDAVPEEATSKLFTRKPLSFLQEWLAVRRKGQDFAHTPMGHICQGKPLLESHPFFTRHGATRQVPRVKRAGQRSTVIEEEEPEIDNGYVEDGTEYGHEIGEDFVDEYQSEGGSDED